MLKEVEDSLHQKTQMFNLKGEVWLRWKVCLIVTNPWNFFRGMWIESLTALFSSGSKDSLFFDVGAVSVNGFWVLWVRKCSGWWHFISDFEL